MKNLPRAVFVALAVMAMEGKAENAKEEALRLIAADVKSGGKSVPNGPKPTLTKPKESKTVDEGDPEVFVLPKVEVTAPKLTPLREETRGVGRGASLGRAGDKAQLVGIPFEWERFCE